MNPRDIDRWKNEVLGEILVACALSEALRPVLVFKGARILSRRLFEGRMTYDLDSTLAESFALNVVSVEARSDFLEKEIARAVKEYFANKPIIRFTLEEVQIKTVPHPFGWDGYQIRLKIRDAEKAGVLGLPTVDIDVGAPEKFSPYAVSDLRVDHHHVCAYTLERIAGEKLRVFLSSLPAYRKKVGARAASVRVKDLYDLARILEAFPVTDEDFWAKAGEDFRLACEARLIDCAGI